MLTELAIENAAPAIADVLQRYFELQHQEIVREIQENGQRADMDLSHWNDPMTQALLPIITELFRRGSLATSRRLDRVDGERSGYSCTRPGDRRQRSTTYRREYSTTSGNLPANAGKLSGRRKQAIDLNVFDVFNPRIVDLIYRWTYSFCESTNSTSTMRLDIAIEELRSSLSTGLRSGEGIRQLAERTGEIFADPSRAFRIATTEASRAQHGGQYEAARESGVVHGMRWVASGDACPLCLSLDGKTVDFDQPFYVNDKAPPIYRAVYYPPAHPHCMCTATEVI